ncbi:ABC transporter ATP-binding protein [Spirulina sp. CCNP1310]|uniref:ABC transporter ATP-binding protein n=1 Tax=Spirulina sp. CCNP1310 TaxID=3110249 RepID=UPI002B1FD7AC|nr:ABC transporter ATP-binding protein [Spirulina sp. CCNP1310]MEA5420667.1 ABC transporter ATP-binding protein [Spirulina sp. CCNP1310]
MSNFAIRVENLGKKYLLNHRPDRDHYALRYAMANGVKQWRKRLLHPRQRIAHPEIEEFWALQDLSCEIQQGDRVGIVGRNGAGKSTLLKILSRITEPTTGRITLKGRVASLLEVGTGFHPELTGRENIYLNGSILGMTRREIERKFDEIVAFAEIEKFLDTPVKRYSSGMYVRLAFAVAAHLEPEILVIDEVLAVGDAEFQKKCLGKMETVGKDGRTVIFVSHQMGMINQLCNHAFWLHHGVLIQQGSPQNIINAYLESLNKGGSNCFMSQSSLTNKEVYIFSAETVNELGEPQKQFAHNEAICLKSRIRALSWVRNTNFCLVLSDRQGRKILTSEYPLDKIGLKIEEFDLIFRIPSNFLQPNSYHFGLYLHVPNVRHLESISDVCAFTILDFGSDFSMYNEDVDRGCVFATFCEWQVNV